LAGNQDENKDTALSILIRNNYMKYTEINSNKFRIIFEREYIYNDINGRSVLS